MGERKKIERKRRFLTAIWYTGLNIANKIVEGEILRGRER